MRFECFWIYQKIFISRKVRAEKLPLGEKDVAFFAKNKFCIGSCIGGIVSSLSLRLMGEWYATFVCKVVRYALWHRTVHYECSTSSENYVKTVHNDLT